MKLTKEQAGKFSAACDAAGAEAVVDVAFKIGGMRYLLAHTNLDGEIEVIDDGCTGPDDFVAEMYSDLAAFRLAYGLTE